jgi:hypothetical protein
MKVIILVLLFLTCFKDISLSTENIISEQQLEAHFIAKKQYEQSEEIKRRIAIIEAIGRVESMDNPLAYNEKEKGILQIRPIMVKEINSISLHTNYKHSDAWNKEKSIEMFIEFQNRFNPTWDAELAAKKWNGGREGEKNLNTEVYWQKVKQELNNLNS